MKIKIHGKVQGVGYRHWLREKAKYYDLKGECHNSSDGSVSCVVQGYKYDIEALLAKCKYGPSSAGVEKVESYWEEPRETYKDFKIKD